jgi:hypothetical protein
MATKKTSKTSTKAKIPAKKPAAKAKAPKGPKAAKSTLPRHPRSRLVASFSSKAALAKTLAAALARPDEDTGRIESRLKTASNHQLLRLQRVTETVKQKYGNRDKLIAAIGTAEKKSKDKDYLAKLETLSLPHLLELASSAERRARA